MQTKAQCISKSLKGPSQGFEFLSESLQPDITSIAKPKALNFYFKQRMTAGTFIQQTPNWLGKTTIFPVDFQPTECIYDYPMVICYIAIENGHRNR